MSITVQYLAKNPWLPFTAAKSTLSRDRLTALLEYHLSLIGASLAFSGSQSRSTIYTHWSPSIMAQHLNSHGYCAASVTELGADSEVWGIFRCEVWETLDGFIKIAASRLDSFGIVIARSSLEWKISAMGA